MDGRMDGWMDVWMNGCGSMTGREERKKKKKKKIKKKKNSVTLYSNRRHTLILHFLAGTNLGEKNRVGHVRFQNKKYRNLVLFSRLKAGSL